MLRSNLVRVRARIGSTHGDLNLTNVLVTFMTKPNQSVHGNRFDPRCWLIDYEKTRLDGHTGRDYGQLEVSLRREVIMPAYMDLCRQLTAAANVSREQARRIVLTYHRLLEEQFIRHDTVPANPHSVDLEFETIAFTDRIFLRQLSFTSGHGRIEQAWAQMLTSIAIFRKPMDAENRSNMLEREVVFLSADPVASLADGNRRIRSTRSSMCMHLLYLIRARSRSQRREARRARVTWGTAAASHGDAGPRMAARPVSSTVPLAESIWPIEPSAAKPLKRFLDASHLNCHVAARS